MSNKPINEDLIKKTLTDSFERLLQSNFILTNPARENERIKQFSREYGLNSPESIECLLENLERYVNFSSENMSVIDEGLKENLDYIKTVFKKHDIVCK